MSGLYFIICIAIVVGTIYGVGTLPNQYPPIVIEGFLPVGGFRFARKANDSNGFWQKNHAFE